MYKKVFGMFLILIVVTSCTSQTPTISSQQPTYTLYPTYTPLPTYTPFPTSTPLPTNTPTITLSPTPKFTPTSSPTATETETITPTLPPFNVATCTNFKFNSGLTADQEKIYAQLEPFVGKCVALYYRKDPYSGSDDYLLGSDLVYAAEVTIITDEATPSDTLISEDYAKVWGILEAATDIGEPWGLRLRKVENYQKNQMPIEDDGNYTVGKDGDMSPGTWKSGADPTWGSDCYWARINQSTGNIIQNHFGVGGITVRLSEGDIFETNNDCTTWFFINP